jgi:ABC-type uncharacterized transport system substrate-binding protein
MADRILKGAKPADLPIDRAAENRAVINLKNNKQIGLTIPPNVLARADRGSGEKGRGSSNECTEKKT